MTVGAHRTQGVSVEKIDPYAAPRRRRAVRIPPSIFGIVLGLSGLTVLWVFAHASFGGPEMIGDALGGLATIVWVGLTVAYLRQGPRQILADARDATVSPFLAAWVMSAYVLAAGWLEPLAPGTTRAIVNVFLVIGLLVSGLLTGQWLTGGLEEATFGPAFYLPGVGIDFVGADAAATVGLHSIAQLFFGIGVAAWGSDQLGDARMFFRRRLAPSPIPTMAIEMAPAAARRAIKPSHYAQLRDLSTRAPGGRSRRSSCAAGPWVRGWPPQLVGRPRSTGLWAGFALRVAPSLGGGGAPSKVGISVVGFDRVRPGEIHLSRWRQPAEETGVVLRDVGVVSLAEAVRERFSSAPSLGPTPLADSLLLEVHGSPLVARSPTLVDSAPCHRPLLAPSRSCFRPPRHSHALALTVALPPQS
jgi:Voltage-dependent anion channel